MDPDAALDMIREELARYADGEEVDLHRLAEHVEALDTWLSRGGFLPAAWQRPEATR